LLLVDEPPGSLDDVLSESYSAPVEEFNRFCVTVLMANNDSTLITNRNYPIMTLNQGRMLE
jgi:ABC-type ATPase involved in cell division